MLLNRQSELCADRVLHELLAFRSCQFLGIGLCFGRRHRRSDNVFHVYLELLLHFIVGAALATQFLKKVFPRRQDERILLLVLSLAFGFALATALAFRARALALAALLLGALVLSHRPSLLGKFGGTCKGQP